MDFDEANSILEEADPAFVQFRDESRFWIQRVLLPIIGTVGIFGNTITILVLTRRGMRTSTNAYLTALAVADLIYLLCVLWLSLRHYPNLEKDTTWSYVYSHVWPYSLWIADATTNTSAWLTVTFTVERCIAIAKPIKGRVLCTVSRAKKFIIGVYLICFTTSMTTPFEWTVEENTDFRTNTSVFEITSSNLGKMKIYKTIYYWFTSITFVLLPLTLLIIFNSLLIHSFRQSQKLRKILTGRQRVSEQEERDSSRELKITGTLITVVIMFLVCQLPTATTLIYEIFRVTKQSPNEDAILRALGNIFNCLVALNAACNFILYCALSGKYRSTFRLTFFPCFYKSSNYSQSNAFFTHRVRGPKIAHSKNLRHSSYTTPGENPTLVNLHTKGSSRKLSARPQRISSPCKANRYTVPLPIISENGSSSEIFPIKNPSRTPAIKHYQSCSATTSRRPSSTHVSLIKKITDSPKYMSLDSPALIFSSWPNIWPCYQSPFSKIPLEDERIIRVLHVPNAKEFPVTSCSV